jgi:hypothetical protein
MSPKLLLHSVTRRRSEEVEELTFEPGVNLIVGPRNSGKTKWLQTIDYLLGDDIDAEERTTDDIFQKYDSATLSFLIGPDYFTVERRWKQSGFMSKVLINGDAISLKEYRELLMRHLGIPIVHFPQGNPMGSRAWPELGWRRLFRHIYRQQRFWGTFADQQPDSEQHASLMQFLGAAGSLFSSDFDMLVQKQKQVLTMEAQKEQFLSVLNQVTREVVQSEELGIAITPNSLDAAMQRLQTEHANVQLERERVLANVCQRTPDANTGAISELSNGLLAVRAERERNAETLQKLAARVQELNTYHKLLTDESGRLERAFEGGSLLVDLKVTHCPACDQEVKSTATETNQCYLCRQAIAVPNGSFRTAGKRIQFEAEQLQAELAETQELIGMLEIDLDKHRQQDAALLEKQSRIEESLQPIRSAVAAILPPELALFDMEVGRIQEQVRQLQRVRSSLEYREILNAQIETLHRNIAEMEAPIAAERGEIDFRSWETSWPTA